MDLLCDLKGLNRKIVESRTLTTHLKQALKTEQKCVIEIRAPLGAESHVIGERLLKSLTLAGAKAELVNVAASPSAGILIEASQECARAALSLQTAFGAAGLEAHLLIQSGSRSNTVVLHLGQEQMVSQAP